MWERKCGMGGKGNGTLVTWKSVWELIDNVDGPQMHNINSEKSNRNSQKLHGLMRKQMDWRLPEYLAKGSEV